MNTPKPIEGKLCQQFQDNMSLNVAGTSKNPGPYWFTKYPSTIRKSDHKDNRKDVHGAMLYLQEA